MNEREPQVSVDLFPFDAQDEAEAHALYLALFGREDTEDDESVLATILRALADAARRGEIRHAARAALEVGALTGSKAVASESEAVTERPPITGDVPRAETEYAGVNEDSAPPSPTLVAVVINGRVGHGEPGQFMTYEEAVARVGLEEHDLPLVSWSVLRTRDGGILLPGQSVLIRAGLVLNVART